MLDPNPTETDAFAPCPMPVVPPVYTKFKSLYPWGLSTTTIGDGIEVYPDPGLEIESEVTVPPDPIVDVNVAPTPDPPINVICGVVLYPEPKPFKYILLIVPDDET